MVAVILAGGKGTRLKPFTMTIPKPLLPLGDVPILEIVIRQLAAAGVERVVLCVGHMAHLFTGLIGDGARWGVKVEYAFEDSPLGTAGPLRLVKDPGETFLVMNGDLLTTLDYRAMLAKHAEVGAQMTVALARREERIDYGVVVPGADGFVADYVEKPVSPYLVSMGINVVSREALARIPEGRFDIPQLVMSLVNAGKKVYCHRPDCYWQDIGRFDDYQRASEDFTQDPQRFLPPA
jgi:NDP-sugar pyrophosphorylase family protein